MRSLPNTLTAIRLFVAPLVVVLIFMGSPTSAAYIGVPELCAWIAFGLFVFAGITDGLDGYLARSKGWISRLGKMMDPIADKVLVTLVLAALLATDRLTDWHFIPASVIILRELFISGMREFLSGYSTDLPVSFISKIKTLLQILALGFLIVAPATDSFMPASVIGLTLTWVAALVTLTSAYLYVQQVLPQMGEMGQWEQSEKDRYFSSDHDNS